MGIDKEREMKGKNVYILEVLRKRGVIRED